MTQMNSINGAPTGGANPWLDSLVGDGAWQASADGKVHLTYALRVGADPNKVLGGLGSSWSQDEANAMAGVFKAWSAVTNVLFTRVSDTSNADLWEWKGQASQFDQGTLAWHEMPANSSITPLYGAYNERGYGWTSSALKPGGQGFLTILHEIGHALGLSHPHESATAFPGVTAEFDSFGTYNLNQGIFTTMSYNAGWATRFPQDQLFGFGAQMTPMALDIAAVQNIYGANMSYHKGADAYVMPKANLIGTGWVCIWDAGGIDKISAGNTSTAATIDLRAATLTGTYAGGYVSWHKGIWGGFTIANGVIVENASGGRGSDTINGNAVANTLFGGAGNDQLHGNAGNDVVDGGDGADKAYGEGGDDRLLGSAGNDLLNGGSGADTADYSKFTTAILINLGAQAAVSTKGAGFDRFLGIENAVTGSGQDVIRGTEGANRLDGRAGNDKFYGLGGGDVLAGGMGNDDYYGGAGNDTVSFSAQASGVSVNLQLAARQFVSALMGSDLFSSVENVIGTSGNDVLSGSAAGNKLNGGAGNDRLDGRGGADVLSGDAGADTFVFSTGANSGNADYLANFQASQDIIELHASVFTALTAGQFLPPEMLALDLSGVVAETRIIYDQSSGMLFYDQDGDGASQAVQIAQLNLAEFSGTMSEANFLIA